MAYSVYILECNDGTYYTGITNNLEKRLHAHNHTQYGARYTRGRRPVCVVYEETCTDKGSALQREHAIKQLSHTEKASIIATYLEKRV